MRHHLLLSFIDNQYRFATGRVTIWRYIGHLKAGVASFPGVLEGANPQFLRRPLLSLAHHRITDLNATITCFPYTASSSSTRAKYFLLICPPRINVVRASCADFFPTCNIIPSSPSFQPHAKTRSSSIPFSFTLIQLEYICFASSCKHGNPEHAAASLS